MVAYYNEFDPKAAAWLRQLIKNGNIAEGIVDERSITEVTPDDLRGFNQHHFFAGIGVWSHALRTAGWADDRPVWTASLPCQPFSVAGNQKGKDDERHLLPHFIELVRQCQPNVIFGEQVESAIRHEWLDDLQANMEAEGFSLGHCVLGAHSVGKAHIRQRIYWVAAGRVSNPANSGNIGGLRQVSGENEKPQAREEPREDEAGKLINDSSDNGVADSNRQGLQGRGGHEQVDGEKGRQESMRHAGKSDISSGLGNTEHDGQFADKVGRSISESEAEGGLCEFEGSSTDSIDWLYCRDNKYRPIKSGLKPLVDGLARGVVYRSDTVITPNDTGEARTQRLKGYGNAIVAPVAAEFIMAYMQC